MERKIGEIFEFGCEWYQCVEGTCNNECYFYSRSLHKTIADINGNGFGACNACFRNDNESVIFKKLEKVGGAFACRNMSLGCYGIIVQRYKVFAKPILTDNSIKWCDFTNGTILIALINKEDMEEKNNGNTPLNVLMDKYVNGDICYDDFEKEVKALYSCKEEIKPTLKDFDLEAAKQGKPVCTRDGHKARIICFDKGGIYPVIALVQEEGSETCHFYAQDGKCADSGNGYDLLMLSEKKEGWVNVYRDCDGANITKDDNIYSSREAAIASAQFIDENHYVATTKINWEE